MHFVNIKHIKMGRSFGQCFVSPGHLRNRVMRFWCKGVNIYNFTNGILLNIFLKDPVILQSSSSYPPVIPQSSASHPPVIPQSSPSHPPVIPQSSPSHPPVIFPSSSLERFSAQNGSGVNLIILSITTPVTLTHKCTAGSDGLWPKSLIRKYTPKHVKYTPNECD